MNLTWHNEKRKISELIPYVANPRQITEKQSKDLKASLDKFGLADPIIINTTNEIIGGHKRTEIMERLMSVAPDYEVDVRVPDRELTIDESRELNVRLNKNSGEWDFDILANNFDLDDLLEWGFEKSELDLDLWVSEEPADNPGAQIDRAEELREIWGVETGQLWQLGEHRLICGDCTDKAVVERVMGGERADCVFTDPPYGIGQKGVPGDEPDNLQKLIDDCVPLLPIENAVCVAFQSTRTFPVWLDAIRNNGHKFERILSLYKEAQCTFPWRGWILISESILVSTVGNGDWQDIHPYHHDAYSVSEVSHEISDDLGWHGSIKPIEVVVDILSRIVGTYKIVYDPFLGSGTTLIACERLGRKCRAVEISPAYVAVAIQRWVDMTCGEPVLLEK